MLHLHVITTWVYYPPVVTTWKILTTGASYLTTGTLCSDGRDKCHFCLSYVTYHWSQVNVTTKSCRTATGILEWHQAVKRWERNVQVHYILNQHSREREKTNLRLKLEIVLAQVLGVVPREKLGHGDHWAVLANKGKNIWKYLTLFGNIWKYLTLFGNIWG